MENELSRVVDALPGLIWTACPDGNVDFLNQRWCQYTGLRADESFGHGWQVAIHPADLAELLEHWKSILASGEAGEIEARLRRFDGEYRWFLFRISPLADSCGRLVKWCGMNTDIEDRKTNEEALRESERRASSILDALPIHVNILTPEGIPLHLSRQYREYVGATLEEHKRWEIGQNFHPDDREESLATWRRSAETGQPFDCEARRRRADGTYRWFHLRASPLRDAQGHIVLWFSVHTDIDDRKRAEALVAGEKRLLEMVASGHSMPRILEALCQLVESTATGCYCSVVLVDPRGNCLEQGVAPSLPASFVRSINGRPVNADSGPCAMAAYLNEQIIAADLTSETRWAEHEWCQMALAHGLQACWSTPISSAQSEVLGAFAIYYAEPRVPTSQDQALIDQFTHVASIAIERQRSQTTLMRALAELRIAEARLRTIIDAIPGFVWSAASDGNVDFVNQRWCDYTGVSKEDTRGSGWQSAVHPDDAGPLRDYWQALLQSGEPGQFETRLRCFDGTFRWFLIKAVPLRDETGQVVKWYGQNTDIDDRKQAENLLAGEKRLLEMMADGCSLTVILEALCELVEATASGCYCSVLLVDPRRTHSHCGAAPALRLQPGAAPSLPASLMEGIDGRPVNIDSGPCAMAATLNQQVIAADLVSETRWDAWCRLVMAHGMRANWSTPISSTSGKVLGTFAILYGEAKTPTPIHQNLIAQFTHLASIAIERAQGEAALKRSEAFLVKAQRLSSSGSFSWHVGADEITCSEQVYRIFELDPDLPVTLERVASRQHPEDTPLLQDLLDRVQAGKDFEYEHRLQMTDGSVKYLHTVAHGAWDQNGQLEYIGAVHDVTERRLSEEALGKVRSELAHVARVTSLGALTASIAHEVNQPLSGIITNASTCLRMLAADPPNVDGARETARRTIRDGNRASDVITRLRALFAKKSVTAERVDLNEASREVIALSRSELQRSRVTLRTDFAEDVPSVIGDRVQLQQVILNLLLNASDAMSGVGDHAKHLVIRTRYDDGDRARLSVQDSGVGIDTQNVDTLFQAFYTTKSEGMGIGLSISRSIIESHHGRLWAETNDGPGATFSFSIPCNAEDVTESQIHGAMRTRAVTEGQHVMRNP
jgi:PAS domain S-box-containing protein